jgi:hypothetical protein
LSTPSRKQNAERHPTELVPRLAYSVAEFCASINISLATYAKMKQAGQGPREAKVWDGCEKVIITHTAAAEWIAARDRAAQEAADHMKP